MTINLNHGGPAFPFVVDDGKKVQVFTGMTLRDWFAGQALMGLLASWDPTFPRFPPDDDARHAYAVADAMLAAREEKP